MFTIKLYRHNGGYQRIYEAESFTILRTNEGSSNGPFSDWAEITAHVKGGAEDWRADVGESPYSPSAGVWEKAIIENAAGRTTQIIGHDIPIATTASKLEAA